MDGPFSQGKPTTAWCRRPMHRKSKRYMLNVVPSKHSKTLNTTHNAEPRMHGNTITRNYFENWRRQKRLRDTSMSSRPRFSLEMTWKSRFARAMRRKVFLEKTICHHLRIHDTTRKPFFRYYTSCFSQNTIQNMKNIQLFLSCSSCLCSFIFTAPARICNVTMSHTSIYC